VQRKVQIIFCQKPNSTNNLIYQINPYLLEISPIIPEKTPYHLILILNFEKIFTHSGFYFYCKFIYRTLAHSLKSRFVYLALTIFSSHLKVIQAPPSNAFLPRAHR